MLLANPFVEPQPIIFTQPDKQQMAIFKPIMRSASSIRFLCCALLLILFASVHAQPPSPWTWQSVHEEDTSVRLDFPRFMHDSLPMLTDKMNLLLQQELLNAWLSPQSPSPFAALRWLPGIKGGLYELSYQVWQQPHTLFLRLRYTARDDYGQSYGGSWHRMLDHQLARPLQFAEVFDTARFRAFIPKLQNHFAQQIDLQAQARQLAGTRLQWLKDEVFYHLEQSLSCAWYVQNGHLFFIGDEQLSRQSQSLGLSVAFRLPLVESAYLFTDYGKYLFLDSPKAATPPAQYVLPYISGQVDSIGRFALLWTGQTDEGYIGKLMYLPGMYTADIRARRQGQTLLVEVLPNPEGKPVAFLFLQPQGQQWTVRWLGAANVPEKKGTAICSY